MPGEKEPRSRKGARHTFGSSSAGRILTRFVVALGLAAVRPAAGGTGLIQKQDGTPRSDVPPVAVAEEAPAAWWFAPSTTKVFPDAADTQVRVGRLWAARGEYESIQLAVVSGAGEEHVSVVFTGDESDGAGFVPIPGEWAELFEVRFVRTPGVASWGFPPERPELRRAVYPDPLMPLRPGSSGGILPLPADRPAVLWVRIAVPSDAAPGDYAGRITIRRRDETSGAPPLVAAPLRLHVWPFRIPRASSLRTAFGLTDRDLAQRHDVPRGSEAHREIYRRYYDTLLDYRLCAFHVPYGVMDDRALPYLLDDRVNTFIAPYRGDPSFMRRMWDRLETLGVGRKAWVFNVDEAETREAYDVLRDQAEYVQRVAPRLRYGMTFFTGPAWDGSLTPLDVLAGYVDLWICQTDYYTHGHGLGDVVRRRMRERQIAGDETWLYVALAPRHPFCNLLINNTALQHRLLFWQVFAEEHISGFAYWNTVHWSEVGDPLEDVGTVKGVDPHIWGDGLLLYPGTSVGRKDPLPSLRIECVRDGLEDYELLTLVQAALGRRRVMQHVEELTRGFTEYTDDPAAFDAVRLRLGNLLAREVRQAEGRR